MRFIMILLLMLALNIVTNGQEKPFERVIGWKGGGNANPIRVMSISNEAKDVHCVLVSKNEALIALWFDREMNFIKESASKNLHGESVLGGYIKDNNAVVFLKDQTGPFVQSIVFNRQNESVEKHQIPFDLQGKKYIGQLNAGSRFLYITADKKEPVISVFNFNEAARFEQLDFDLSREDLKTGFSKNDLWKALSKNAGWSRSVDAAVVNSDLECDVDFANAPNKIYYRNDSLLLAMDREPGVTQIFSMNVKSRDLGYKKIERGMGQDNSTFNSFLLDDKLYYVFATSDKLTVCINRIADGGENMKYVAEADKNIDFKNTPIIQEGGGTIYSKNVERELDKTKQLLRKMTAGRSVITAIRNSDNQDEITIGAYKEMKASAGGYSPGYAGGMAGGGVTLFFRPGYSASWNRVTRFKMLLEPRSSVHIDGEVRPSVNEQIQEYSKDLKIPEGSSSVLYANQVWQYAYYDRDEKKLVIVKFN